MRRLPAPIDTFIRKARYQEDHSGFPILIRIFMAAARQTGYLIWGIMNISVILLSTSFLVGDIQWALRFLGASLTIQIIIWVKAFRWSSLDVLGHLGFVFFHRLIRQ